MEGPMYWLQFRALEGKSKVARIEFYDDLDSDEWEPFLRLTSCLEHPNYQGDNRDFGWKKFYDKVSIPSGLFSRNMTHIWGDFWKVVLICEISPRGWWLIRDHLKTYNFVKSLDHFVLNTRYRRFGVVYAYDASYDELCRSNRDIKAWISSYLRRQPVDEVSPICFIYHRTRYMAWWENV